jgi:hypothetical protein
MPLLSRFTDSDAFVFSFDYLFLCARKIQQSVLGDEHPIVSSTIDSIQLVEAAANPLSHHALLMKQAAAACAAAEPAEVVNEIIETFEDISPKNWFANPCGPVAYNPKDDQ